jgi:hypothetical protein
VELRPVLVVEVRFAVGLFVVGRLGVFDLLKEGAGGADGRGGVFGGVVAGGDDHVRSTRSTLVMPLAFLSVNSLVGGFSGAGGVTSAAKAGKGDGLFCHG